MTAVTMRQRQVPDPLLGRVPSLNGTVAGGAEALGALIGGVLAAVGGIRAPMLIGALVSIHGSCVIFRLQLGWPGGVAGSQGVPARAVRIASSAVRPWFAAESR